MNSGLMNEMLLLLLQSNDAMSVDPHLDAHSCVLDGSQSVQVNPSAQYPSFLKQLLKSHLSGKFYLGLPKKFCDAHLPGHDDTVVLVDEDDQEYNTRYSVRKNRLSGGWRGFSNSHKLLEGDTLVFHLIEHGRFKVYIARAGKLTENDEDMVLRRSELKDQVPIVKAEHKMGEGGKAKRSHPISFAVDSHQRARRMPYTKPGNAIDEVSSCIIQSMRSTTPDSNFKEMRNFEGFSIEVDGLNLDSEVAINVRTRYFYLCCSQKMFLHEDLMRGVSSNLAVAIITEIVTTADAIRSSNLTISLGQLQCWEKTLKAFEYLGMKVGFMRDRLHKLIHLSQEHIATGETRRVEIVEGDKQMRKASLALNLEADAFKNEMMSLEYRQVAGAPW